jgi:hypothetical protein
MGFKSQEELQHMIEGGVYKCGPHDFICDIEDLESIRKHEDENEHYIKGTADCQRCRRVKVSFEGLLKPARNPDTGLEQQPAAFCDDCKEALKKELGF